MSVPVLSVQIIFTHPSVSTEANCLTSALFLANLFAAKVSAMLTCVGKPCGIMAIQIPIAKMNDSLNVRSAISDMMRRSTHNIIVPIVSFFEIFFISICNGVSSGTCSCERFAIFQSWVFIPVANTIHRACHVATVVPIHTQLFLSESRTSPSISCVYLFCGLDSPVREKSFV